MKNKALMSAVTAVAVFSMLFSGVFMAFAAPPAAAPLLLDPKTIPKYVNQLVANIPVYTPSIVADASSPSGVRHDYTVSMVAFDEEILPVGTPVTAGTPLGPGGAPLTHVWGYEGLTNVGIFHNSPSATFIETRHTPSKVTWVNLISEPQFLPVDPTIHWADPTATPGTMTMWSQPFPTYPGTFSGTVMPGNTPRTLNAQTPVPLVPHLHGGEVQSFSDGGPEAWFTYNGLIGPKFCTNGVLSTTPSNQAVYYYPNGQNPNTQWYHDHALGMTRLNVMSGLAGIYILRDPNDPTDAALSGAFTYGVNEIPLAIQDRSFYANGQLWFPTVGINPTINPYWMPEFFGNTIMVNGKVWPNLDVTQGWYRFRLLEGSNARFYTLKLFDKVNNVVVPMTVIGSDGGYLGAPAVVNSLTMAPGERYDVLVDFSAVPVGTKIILQNNAKAPFPNGAPADPQTVGEVMQFTVKASSANPGAAAPTLPVPLNPQVSGAFPTLAAGTRRLRTLFEVMGPAGPMMVTVNGQRFDGILNDQPTSGSTEDWVIINLTGDTHPIHTHLATFQLVSRQPFQASKYMKAWLAAQTAKNGGVAVVPPFPDTFDPATLDPTPYLQGAPTPARPVEMGWKDTVQVNPGEVTIFRIRFTQQDGTAYPFNPTLGPGYVWHCHIVDHEDNEMMRPYIVT